MKKITPHLWYNKDAKQAAEYYVEVFNANPFKKSESKINNLTVLKDTPSGDCDVLEFELDGQNFMAISAGPLFHFNESVSFLISCDSQEEIDYFWEKLSAVPKAEACGWCKDKFGLSWQIWSFELGVMMSSGESEKLARMQPELWKMKKLDVFKLKQIFNG